MVHDLTVLSSLHTNLIGSFLVESTSAELGKWKRRWAGVRNFLERISQPNDTNIAVPISIAHGEEASRMPISEAFRMWDVATRNVYVVLVVSKLEDHVRLGVACPKTSEFGDESCTRSKTDALDALFTPTWD